MPGEHRPDRKLIGVWMPLEDWRIVERAAHLAGHTTTSYTRHTTVSAARKVLARVALAVPKRRQA